MQPTIRGTVASLILVGAAVLGVPAASYAAVHSASDVYPPSGSCTAPSTTSAGGTITLRCDAGTFSSDETVTITVTGENGTSAAIGMVKFAISTTSGTATSTAEGGLAGVQITLPNDASGTYNLAAVSPTSAGGTAAVTVTTLTGGLPTTGGDGASWLGLWIGGGALVLAGGALAVAGVVRRSRG